MNNLSVENFNAKLVTDRKVYIPNQSGHDFSNAEHYGFLEYVTKGILNPFSVNQMARSWVAKLKKSNKEDYIMVTSLTVLTVIGAALFGHIHGRINLLLYSPRHNRYISRIICFRNLIKKEKE